MQNWILYSQKGLPSVCIWGRLYSRRLSVGFPSGNCTYAEHANSILLCPWRPGYGRSFALSRCAKRVHLNYCHNLGTRNLLGWLLWSHRKLSEENKVRTSLVYSSPQPPQSSCGTLRKGNSRGHNKKIEVEASFSSLFLNFHLKNSIFTFFFREIKVVNN